MSGGRSEGKGMGLRGADTSLRPPPPPPPPHFLFHFLSSLNVPSLPPFSLVSHTVFLHKGQTYTHMLSGEGLVSFYSFSIEASLDPELACVSIMLFESYK